MAKLLSRLTTHSGTTFEVAATVAPKIMAGLAAYLTPARRDLVASELPDQLADAVSGAGLEAVPIEEQLLGPNIKLGRAHELVASMCRALAEVLSNEALAALRSSVPAGLVGWFDPPASPVAKTAPGSTLASGRPGSSHPISEAHPDPTRAIR